VFFSQTNNLIKDWSLKLGDEIVGLVIPVLPLARWLAGTRLLLWRAVIHQHYNFLQSTMALGTIVDSLRRQIASCEAQLKDLRQQLAEAENLQSQQRAQATELMRHNVFAEPSAHDFTLGIHDDFASEITAALSHTEDSSQDAQRKWPLDSSEYKRYGRQLIMPEIGLQGTCQIIRVVSFVSVLGSSY
jgi:predicted ribosome quality control (RQC) complex YloA/Tae2 family protein